MTVYATRLVSGADTAARLRVAQMLSLPVGSAPLTSVSALRPDGGGVVAVVAGSMSVTVQPFVAWVQGDASVDQGGYPFVCDAQVTLTLAAGHASLTRVDTIAGVVRDNPFDGSGSVDARVIVVPGTPGSGAPVLPANCVPLRDVIVPAGTSAGGGGLTASNLSTDRRVCLAPQRGTAQVFFNAAATGTSGVVAFPTPYPTGTTPTVIAMSVVDGFVAAISTVNSAGFTISGRSLTGSAGPGNVPFFWIAMP